MEEPEHARMKRLAREPHRRLERAASPRASRDRRPARASIGCIADQRMADMGQGGRGSGACARFPAGTPQARQTPCRARRTLERRDSACARLARLAQHRHALAVERVAPEIALDQACALARRAPDDGVIARAPPCARRIAWRGSASRARSWRRQGRRSYPCRGGGRCRAAPRRRSL